MQQVQKCISWLPYSFLVTATSLVPSTTFKNASIATYLNWQYVILLFKDRSLYTW